VNVYWGNTNRLGKIGHTHTSEAKALMSEQKLGNTNRLGTTHTAETKAAMSAVKKGKPHTAERIEQIQLNQPNRKPVFVYDQDNKLVGKFLSQSEAAKVLNCNVSSVSRNVDTGKRLRNIYLITTSPLP